MDPLYVLKAMWAHKLLAIPLVLLVFAACVYAFMFGPRSYESSSSYVLITPGLPSPAEMLADPSLLQKTDNPYLRSVDPSLAAQVVVARLASQDVANTLVQEGLSPDYAVLPASEFGSGQIIRVSSTAGSPELAVATTSRLGELLSQELQTIQLIKGADSQYLMTAQAINPPGGAVERMSSRLRTVVMIGIGGMVLIFGAVSLARMLEIRKEARTASAEAALGPVPEGVEQTPPSRQGPTRAPGSGTEDAPT